jgi:hypothetical protein
MTRVGAQPASVRDVTYRVQPIEQLEPSAGWSPSALWTPALAHERCNFHPTRVAVTSYIGTPVCEVCQRRLRGTDRPAG